MVEIGGLLSTLNRLPIFRNPERLWTRELRYWTYMKLQRYLHMFALAELVPSIMLNEYLEYVVHLKDLAHPRSYYW